jgi:hypothetical protein
MITSVSSLESPIFFDFRSGRNNQFNFLMVILEACKRGFLSRGDYLILDNAAIHSGKDMIPLLQTVLQKYGIMKMNYFSFIRQFLSNLDLIY